MEGDEACCRLGDGGGLGRRIDRSEGGTARVDWLIDAFSERERRAPLLASNGGYGLW